MRHVTGSALAIGGRHVRDFSLQGTIHHRVMAPGAQLVCRREEQCCQGACMGFMATGADARLHWHVGTAHAHPVLYLLMALAAEIEPIGPGQRRVSGTVGQVAVEAVPTGKSRVHDFGIVLGLLLLVATEAEFCRIPCEKVFGNVPVCGVAGSTIIAEGFVHNRHLQLCLGVVAAAAELPRGFAEETRLA